MAVGLLTREEALAKIDQCEWEGDPIMGVDAFFVVDGRKRPDMNGILDCSLLLESGREAETYVFARRHVTDFKQTLEVFFEIVTVRDT